MPTELVLLILAITGFPGDPSDTPRKAHAFLAEGRNGMVVGLTGRRSVHAGLEILKQGGSAADAAMATSMTQIVEAAGSYISFAGILSMTYFDASTGKVHFLNAGFNTPLEEKDPLSIPRTRSLCTAVRRQAAGPRWFRDSWPASGQPMHGSASCPWTGSFEPAIRLAEEGFEVDAMLAGSIQFRKDVLSRLPETRRIFTRENGKLYDARRSLPPAELAATLRAVAGHGSCFMYSGDWSRAASSPPCGRMAE